MLYGNHSQYGIDFNVNMSELMGLLDSIQNLKNQTHISLTAMYDVNNINQMLKDGDITEQEARKMLIDLLKQSSISSESMILQTVELMASFANCIVKAFQNYDGQQSCDIDELSRAAEMLTEMSSRHNAMIDEIYANLKYSKSAFALISKKGVQGEEAVPGHRYAQERLQKKKSRSDDDCDDLPF